MSNSGIATNPTDTIAEVDKTTTMSCVTVETTLPTVDIAWSSSSGNMENTEVQLTSAPGVTSGNISTCHIVLPYETYLYGS